MELTREAKDQVLMELEVEMGRGPGNTICHVLTTQAGMQHALPRVYFAF